MVEDNVLNFSVAGVNVVDSFVVEDNVVVSSVAEDTKCGS